MAVSARTILLLAGRLAAWADARHLRPLVDCLGRLGFGVEVVCLSGGSILGCACAPLEYPGLANRWRQAWNSRRLRAVLSPQRPDLLHVLHPDLTRAGVSLAEHWRIPYVQTVNEFLPPGGRLSLSPRWCRAILAGSRDLADDLVRRLGLSERLVGVGPLDIPLPEREATSPGAGKVPVVGSTGPLVEGSGLAVFLDAAQHVVEAGIDAEFVIAGHGNRETALRRRVEQLRITDRVTFSEDAFRTGAFWNLIDVFCQPSLVPAVGRALATALAHGVPSIASDVKGLRDWDNVDAGVRLITPGDAQLLAQAMLELLADPHRAREIGRRAQVSILSSHDPSRAAQLLAAVYEHLLSQERAEETAPSRVAGLSLLKP